MQFVAAKPQSPLLPPLFHRGERSHSVVECDRLRVIKPLTHCCSRSRTNPHRTHCSLTSERCNLLSRRHEVLLTNAHCQRQSRCDAVAQIKMLRPRKLLNICLKPLFCFVLNSTLNCLLQVPVSAEWVCVIKMCELKIRHFSHLTLLLSSTARL